MRDRIVVRLAVNEAGPLIAEILKENGIELPGVTWDSVFPYWLIACDGDQAIGCCQVLIAKPVGFVEFLFVRKSAKFKMRAIAMRKLMAQSISTLQMFGCTYVGGVLAEMNFKFSEVIEKMSFVKTCSANVYARRVA